MKKFSLLLSMLVLAVALMTLSGCFGENGTENGALPIETMEFFRVVESSEFRLQVPEDWETIQEFTSDYPENTIVAFRNNIHDHSFLANLNITKNSVPKGTTTQDYALKLIEIISGQLINFQTLNKEETTININGEAVKTIRFEFKGTNDRTTPTRHFIQIYGVKGTAAYILTASYDDKDSELAIDQVTKSIGTFEIR